MNVRSVIILTICLCACHQKEHKVTAALQIYSLGVKKTADKEYLLLKTILFNYSSDTLKFQIESCDPWASDCVIDNDSLYISQYDCQFSIPIMMKIDPRGQYENALSLFKFNDSLKDQMFRVGFILRSEIFAQANSKLTADTIWSNSLKW
jgi:hypothetical protein